MYKNRNGNKAKNVLKNCVYSKFQTISNASNKEFAEGELLGLMTEDAQKADDIFHMIAGLCHMPFNTFGTFFFLLYYFGTSFLVSLAILIVAFFLNKTVGLQRKQMHKEMKNFEDQASNELNEVLSNAKMLKLYGWQEKFKERIRDRRQA